MKCRFCDEAMQISVSEGYAPVTIYMCKCGTHYGYDNVKEECSYYYFRQNYREKIYLAIFYVSRDGVPEHFVMTHHDGGSLQEIFRLNYLPRYLTPHNFVNKLSTLLTFS